MLDCLVMTETTTDTEAKSKGLLEQLQDEWEADAPIQKDDLARESAHVPYLHSKYLRKASRWSGISKKLGFELEELYKLKYCYYSGRMTKEELDARGWKQFGFTLKSEVKNYVEADPDIMALRRKKAFYDQLVEECVMILKEINQRGFHIKNMIDYWKFKNGSN